MTSSPCTLRRRPSVLGSLRRSAPRAFVLAACAGLGSGPGASRAAADGTSATAETALDAFFHGAVVGLSGAKVRLRYDFSSPAQEKDWLLGVPFPTERGPSDGISFASGVMSVTGAVGVHHLAEWEGDVVVSATLAAETGSEVGGFLSAPDRAGTYVICSLAGARFRGEAAGADTDAGIFKFDPRLPGENVVGASRPSLATLARTAALRTSRPVSFRFGRATSGLTLVADGAAVRAAEPGEAIATMQPGFFLLRGRASIDEIVVEGTLSSRYVALHRLALRTDAPLAAEPVRPTAPSGPVAIGGVDPAVTALCAAYERGTRSAGDLVRVIAEAARPDGDRLAAASALKAGPHRAAAAAIDLLLAADPRSRTIGIDVVRALTGRDYGFAPGAPEKARSAAIRRLQADVPALTRSPGW